MNCRQARRLISDHLDAPLAPASLAALSAHLDQCAECAAYASRLRVRLAGISQLPRTVPARPRTGVMVRAESDRGLARRSRGSMVAQGVSAACVVVLIAGLAFSLFRSPSFSRGRDRGATPTTSASVADDPATPVISVVGQAPATTTTTGSQATPVTAASGSMTPQPALALAQEEVIWDTVGRATGLNVAPLLRPTRLPAGLESIRIDLLTKTTFSVSYLGGGKRLTVALGQPEATLPAGTRQTTQVRGQPATLVQAGATLGLSWGEAGRWDLDTPFTRNRLPYSVTAQGFERAEVEAVADALAAQATGTVATDLIRRFYAAINARDYQAAYRLFDQSMQGSFEAFVAGYSETARDDLEIMGVLHSDALGQYLVAIRLQATNTDGTRHWYSGSYEIGGSPGAARIVAAKVSEISEAQARSLAPAPTPAPCGASQATLSAETLIVPAGNPGTGEVALQVTLGNSGAACLLTVPLVVTITADDGSLLPVSNNGVPLTPDAALQASGARLTFRWANWCNGRGPYSVRVTLSEAIVTVTQAELPRCTDPQQSSRLSGP